MAVTGAGFSGLKNPPLPDLTKAAEGFMVTVAAGAGATQTVDAVSPEQSVTVVNYTDNFMRGLIKFTPGIQGVGAQDGTFFLAPGGIFSFDFSSHENDNAVGSISAIDSVELIAIDPSLTPGVANGAAIVGAVAAKAGFVIVNFGSA